MQQQGDFTSSYYHHPSPSPSSSSSYPHLHQQQQQQNFNNPNPNPNSNLPLPDYNNNPNSLLQSYASAPPFTTTTTNYSGADYQSYQPSPPPPLQQPSSSSSQTSYHHHDFVNPNNEQQQHPFIPSPQQPSPSLHEQQPVGSYQSQPPHQQNSYYPSFDQSYTPVPPMFPSNSNPNSVYPVPCTPVGPSLHDTYQQYEKPAPGGYYDDNLAKYEGGYGRSRSDLGSGLYGKQQLDNSNAFQGYDDGVRPYQGSKVEPYGARGTGSKSSTWGANFDDYGRPINVASGKETAGSAKIVRAVPQAETQQDVKGGVQKFKVKLLAESGGQSNMDVLCQIGLDGIRMLDPNTNRLLRIYPLDTITRCEVAGPSILAFWSKSSVDIESRRIRLQSSSYTTNTILDTLTAATFQLKEMGGRIKPSDSPKANDQPTEKKKGFTDWMTKIKPANEEKEHWIPDEAVTKCTSCGSDFGAFLRRHHCRNCGDIFCVKCTQGRIALTTEENAQPVRVCDRCLAEVTHRLSNAKEAANKPALQSHEDLAKKLQEEMERNSKSKSGTKSDGTGRRTREVACPICTVHLQVQVPSSGSETIECGVCQHPFLVSAH